MRAFLVLVLWLGGWTVGSAAGFDEAFAVVLIDSKTEAELGEFPLPRSTIAKAVERAAEMKARAVVLKFFYDLPKPADQDGPLIASIAKVPTVLQGRLDDSEANPNPLPPRFSVPLTNAPVSLSGRSGWLPIPALAAKAHDLGFVDLDADLADAVPLVEGYQDRRVKSLVLCCLEAAAGGSSKFESTIRVTLANGGVLPLDGKNRVPVRLPMTDELAYIPFHDFIAGKTAKKEIEGKVVVIGYDGAKIHPIHTPSGEVRAHRFFLLQLRAVWESQKPPAAQVRP